MLVNASSLLKCPILSLHVGGKVAEVTELIVDPNNLEIIACRTDGPLVGKEFGDILPIKSVREFSRLGMIIDSTDEFVESGEILRIKNILDLNFNLFGLKILTKAGAKIGKVSDFAIDPDDWMIRQIVAERPFLKSFLDPELIISRERITEVDDYRVIIDDEKETNKQKSITKAPASPSFVNPFRGRDFAPEPTPSSNREADAAANPDSTTITKSSTS